MERDVNYIWIFNGPRSSLPGGVFSSREVAEGEISEHRLSGVLTRYPIDKWVSEWAVERGFIEANSIRDMGRFTCAQQEHYHYEDGECVSG